MSNPGPGEDRDFSLNYKMVTNNELRIGNWVTGMRNINFQVEKILPVHSSNALIPILLTEGIILSAGFNKQMPDYQVYTKSGVTIKRFVADFYLVHEHDKIGKPFRFVHQFQNLYFALIGEELEIKL